MVRIASFNVENLFARYRFRKNFDPLNEDGFSINNLAFSIYNETAKKLTAKAIKEVNADIIALQEVDNLKVLDKFTSQYLGGMGYKYRILIDAHDPRNIDVAIISKYPITSIQTYRHLRNKNNTASLFSRDCLEVDFNINDKPLTIYVNHFKSMMGGRKETKKRREEQVEAVSTIIENRWGSEDYKGNYAVVGDFNDYLDIDTSLSKLFNSPGLIDVSTRINEDERWTHFWAGGNEYHQLDFILLSPDLANKNPSAPQVLRKGLPYRAEKYIGDRYDFVGESNPKASDHCPIYMDLAL